MKVIEKNLSFCYEDDHQTSNNFFRLSNTAEVQVLQSTMTLKATTQYQMNMTYSGLQQSAYTAQPNNNWYWIVRIHPTLDLVSSNLIGVGSLFNNTQIGSGLTTTFITLSSGQIITRWYVQNQNTTVNLNISNMSVSFFELP
jgi:hypothetical protein